MLYEVITDFKNYIDKIKEDKTYYKNIITAGAIDYRNNFVQHTLYEVIRTLVSTTVKSNPVKPKILL